VISISLIVGESNAEILAFSPLSLPIFFFSSDDDDDDKVVFSFQNDLGDPNGCLPELFVLSNTPKHRGVIISNGDPLFAVQDN
jgi:hypothetical protein